MPRGLKIMFEPPVLTVVGMDWKDAAHGPEPEAVLMTRVRVNGVPIALHAFRTSMPYASGWTNRIAWEDDKSLLGTGILWRQSIIRDHIRALDSGASSILMEHTELEEDEPEWEGRWLMISRILGCSDPGWMPATIRGHRYHIVGTPVEKDWETMDIPSWNISEQDVRRGTDEEGVLHVGMRVEGGACDLLLVRVRAIGGRIRGVNPHLQERLSGLLPIISILGGYPQSMPMKEAHWLPIIVPILLDDWALDTGRMLDELGPELRPGRARWFLTMHSKRFDAFDSRVMESLAEACRNKTLALKEGEAWTARSMTDMLGRLAYGRGGEETRSRVFQTLSRTVLRGVWADKEGKLHLLRSRLAERVYLFEDSLLSQVGRDFTCLASQCPSGALLRLPWGTCILEGDIVDSDTLPAWAHDLPALLDQRIEDFLAEWHEA